MTVLPKGTDFQPPWPFRSGHIQTILSSSGIRRRLLPSAALEVQDGAEHVLVDGGDGVRLTGAYTAQKSRASARGLAVLFHGWEGSVDSTYVLQTGSRLLREGWDVFRLNFRDHGDNLHLNEALFHSCRIDEVVHAMLDLSQRWPTRPLVLAGFSLGGNFALRVALRAAAAQLPLAYVLAICPIIDPTEGLYSLEQAAPWFYQAYFVRKWRRSLQTKQKLFPQHTYFEMAELKQQLRGLTEALVSRNTDFESLEEYLDGYSVSGNILAELSVPGAILTAEDDPVIPVNSFRQLQLPPQVELDVARYGGHCGFIKGWDMTSFIDDYIAARFNAVADAAQTAPVASAAEPAAL